MRAAAHSLAALAAAAAAPVLAGALLLRPSWRAGLRERLGWLEGPEPGAVWVHGASVGEMLAASRLVDRLRKEGFAVFTSTVTPNGRAAMQRARPEVACRFAPLDHPWTTQAALARVRPAALVLIETELWPCWIASAARLSIPVVLVSGRVSDRSYPRYRRLGPVIRPALQRLSAVAARTRIDAERFVALGANPERVSVIGDLKLDTDEQPRPLEPDLDRALSGAPLFVAGSTHPGEETAALAALDALERAGLAAALVLAPRHPERADEVARLVERTGRRLYRRSALAAGALAAGEVLLLDSVGELASVYARAEVAFVGGSLAPVGGHNVVEPVLAGRPVLYGRHVANVRHGVEIVERCGAGREVADAAELGGALAEWMRDPAGSRARGEEGRRALALHRGSAERAAALIAAVCGPVSQREI